MAMEHQSYATKDEFWRLQEALNELSANQAQYSDRIMRLERRNDDSTRVRSVWGPASPFHGGLGSSQHGKTLEILICLDILTLSRVDTKPSCGSFP